LQERTVKTTLERTKVFYLGYNIQISNSSLVLDEELVLMPNQNNSRIQQTLPWKEGDKFELTVIQGNTVFKKVKD
jgi:hypothetical protein